MKTTAVCLTVCVAFLAAGCATPRYEFMSSTPSAATATIRTGETGFCKNGFGMSTKEVLKLKHVNGKPLVHWWDPFADQRGIASITVQPGTYTFVLHYQCWGTFANPVIWLNAEAGHTYTVNYDTPGYSVRAWVIDDVTGMICGGSGAAPDNASQISPVSPPSGPARGTNQEETFNSSSSPSKATPLGDSDSINKLRELKKLKDEGILTEDEYEQRRKAIVDTL